MSPCPPADRLQLLVDDQLSAVEERTVAAHVDTCATCQQRLEELTSAADLPGAVRGDPPDSEVATLLVKRWLQSLPRALEEPNGEGAPGAAEGWPLVKGYEILGELGRG